MRNKIRIIVTVLGLCLATFAFGQAMKPQKWEKVIAEMSKAREGDTISYRFHKNLEWSDFKMFPVADSDSKVHIELTFCVFVKKVNYWNGTINIESYGGIRKDLSWVDSQHESQQLLDYLQLKYEIAHYFAKKSETEINSKKINAGNKDKINGIIETHLNARDKALNDFDIDADLGNKPEMLDKWKKKLQNNEI